MTKTVAVLFAAETAADTSVDLDGTRFADIAGALRVAGLTVVGVPYNDAAADAVRARLLAFGGVLVWVNPLDGAEGRRGLNAILADVAGQGVFVSVHPDIIAKLGTKEVLYETRSMAWGCDTRLYTSLEVMQSELPDRLDEIGACVLKQVRGNGGDGIWKVAAGGAGGAVLVRHAKRGSVEQAMDWDALFTLCALYFDGGGRVIDQPYQPRLADGMIRCYMVHDRVAGFGEQLINALHPNEPTPGPRLYYPPTRADFQPLKDRLETDWLPELCRRFDIDRLALPIIWDTDFLYGLKDVAGNDTYVLCEINVGSVYPFPDDALIPLVAATAAIL